MNFIILNGKKSTEVAGLMIQALPPVVKPPMRVQLDEVDGRDGDIVTPLGFSGYDRTVKIGLRGVYDEDDIVEYFNSSGKVIFSNEPDKVYDYTIVESFSLDRLRKFREADVVFHVQPFKHNTVAEKNITGVPYNNFAQFRSKISSGLSSIVTYTAGKYVFDGTVNYGSTTWKEARFGSKIDSADFDENVTFDVYLTVSGGQLQNGQLKIGVCEYDPDGSDYALTDGYVDVSSRQRQHLTFTVNRFIEADEFVIRCYKNDGATQVVFDNLTIENLEIIYPSTSITINATNYGNIDSAPIYAIKNAANSVQLKANDGETVTITPASTEDITIDVENMKAYNGSTLKNRICTGNYENLKLKPGNNAVSIVGNFTEVIISNYSRWI